MDSFWWIASLTTFVYLFSSMVRKQINIPDCWLRGNIDYGSALRGDIEFRGSILNIKSVTPLDQSA